MRKMLLVAVVGCLTVTVGVAPVRADAVLGNATYSAQGHTFVLKSTDRPLVITRGEDFAITVQVASDTLQNPCDARQCYLTADLRSADGSRILMEDLARHREWARVRLGSQPCPVIAVLSGMIPEKGSVSGALLQEGGARLVIRLFHMKERPSLLDYDDELARLEMPAVIR